MTGGKHSNGDKSKSTVMANQRNNVGQAQTSKMPHMVTRLPISDLNHQLTCHLCQGYLIDATTVVECLHSFCRSCLLRFLETSNTCPRCDIVVNKTQLDKCVRADHTLQDLVYKLVPGLYKSELRRRKDFYLEQCKSVSDDAPSTSSAKSESLVPGGMQIFDKHLVELSAFICTPDEIISFSLETSPKKPSQNDSSGKTVQNSSSTSEPVTPDTKAPVSGSTTKQQKLTKDGKQIEDLNFKRYFRCPAAVTVGHLKKLLAYKMDLSSAHQVEILHSDESLLDEYTLMDIAYIYTWRRKAPMQLFFNICKYETEDEPMPLLIPEVISPPPSLSASSRPSPVTATSSQDVKKEFTTPTSSLLSHARVLDPSDIGGGKKSATSDGKKDVTSSAAGSGIPVVNGGPYSSFSSSIIGNSAAREIKSHQPNSVHSRNISHSTARIRKTPPESTETSMRGKPPLPINRVDNTFNHFGPRSPPVVNNGKMPPLRIALSTPTTNGKKKIKTMDMESTKQNSNSPKKPRIPTKLEPTAPDVLAELQKFVPLAAATVYPTPTVTKSPSIPASTPGMMNAITIETVEKDFLSPVSSTQPPSLSGSDEAVSPLLSPGAAYIPTAAQSACTQPAKLRLKKSLNSVVQDLHSNAMEACSPSKKVKFENGGDDHGATLIH